MERVPVRTDQRYDRWVRLWVELLEVLGPVRQTANAKPLNSPTFAELLDPSPRGQHVVLRTRSDKGARHRSERELEKAPSKGRDVVVVPLGSGIGDNIYLPIGKTEPS